MMNIGNIANILDKAMTNNPNLQPLEPLKAIPITHGNPPVIVKIDPSAKYIVFIDGRELTEEFITHFTTDTNNPLPAGTPVYVINGDIDHAVRIYEIFDSRLLNGKR